MKMKEVEALRPQVPSDGRYRLLGKRLAVARHRQQPHDARKRQAVASAPFPIPIPRLPLEQLAHRPPQIELSRTRRCIGCLVALRLPILARRTAAKRFNEIRAGRGLGSRGYEQS